MASLLSRLRMTQEDKQNSKETLVIRKIKNQLESSILETETKLAEKENDLEDLRNDADNFSVRKVFEVKKEIQDLRAGLVILEEEMEELFPTPQPEEEELVPNPAT